MSKPQAARLSTQAGDADSGQCNRQDSGVRSGKHNGQRTGVATDYGPGVGWPEDRNTLHWLGNRGTLPAVEIPVDIVRPAPGQAPNIPTQSGGQS